jgi:hypothetical protein
MSTADQPLEARVDPRPKRIRVGVVVEQERVPRWIARAVKGALAVACIDLVFLAIDRRSDHVRKRALLSLYATLDRWAFKGVGAAMQKASLRDVLPPGVDVAGLDELRPVFADVILWFSPAPPPEPLVAVTRYGVWTFHPGLFRDDGTFGFLEMLQRSGGVDVAMLCWRDGRPPAILERTRPRIMKSSLARNTDNARWIASAFAGRALSRLASAPDAFLDGLEAPASSESVAPPRHTHGVSVAALAVRQAVDYGAMRARAVVSRNQLCLAYRLGDWRGSDREDFAGYARLIPPEDRFWADPFPAHADGRRYVFFEEAPFETGKGRIVVTEIGDSGVAGPVHVVLERDYHLSYPLVLEWRGNHYMVPETRQNGTIEMYRATRFPFEWRFERTLMEGVGAVDTTLACIGGRWWLFTTMAAVPEASYDDELHVFWSDTPLGPWTPHPRNPVVRDAQFARGAGTIFQMNGTWYRPAQDSSVALGHSIRLKRIIRLDTLRYEEVDDTMIGPDRVPGAVRIHTLSVASGIVAIDFMQHRARRFI